MCETRDLRKRKKPHWHKLVFCSEITIPMRFGCPKDVRKMLVQSARSVHWRKWAAKHEYQELKEGAWLEPALALLRKKVKGNWIENHRNIARKIFLEGGWVKHVTRRKAHKSPGSTIAQSGAKSVQTVRVDSRARPAVAGP